MEGEDDLVVPLRIHAAGGRVTARVFRRMPDQGWRSLYRTGPTGRFVVRWNPQGPGEAIYLGIGSTSHYVRLGAPEGKRLVPGTTYRADQGHPYAAGEAGWRDSLGWCQDPRIRVRLVELTRDAAGEPASLALSFANRCPESGVHHVGVVAWRAERVPALPRRR